MLLRQLLFGSTRHFAPENDQGAEEEPDLDLDAEDDLPLEEPDEDDPEDDPVEDPDLEDDDGEAPAPQQTRGENRVAVATREAKEAKAETERLRREVETLRTAAPAQPRETQEQFNARLAAMEPWERTEYLRQLDAQTTRQELAQIKFENWDRGDKAEYDALAAREPIAAKLRDDVEKILTERRAQGQNVDRTTILKFLIGERALANKGRATGKALKGATARREQQQARPGNGRADTGAGDRRGNADSPSARAKRLEGLEI